MSIANQSFLIRNSVFQALLSAAYHERMARTYTPYRMGTALGHWDAEFLFWLRAQRNFEDFRRSSIPAKRCLGCMIC